MVRKTKEEAAQTRRLIIEAARRVFHECGVGRSTLERIAAAAGVTRGAIYWHFQDKAELFAAMREDVFAPMIERTDSLLFSADFADPLDAIEASLIEFFRVLDDCPVLREVFEIMMLRCEYVDDFARVQEEVGRPALAFLEKIVTRYRDAAAAGALREGLDPDVAAKDTWAFTSGMLHLVIRRQIPLDLRETIPAMIRAHMALRRVVFSPGA